jgi:hypothetical protein
LTFEYGWAILVGKLSDPDFANRVVVRASNYSSLDFANEEF